MAEDTTTALIESQDWLEPVGEQVQKAVTSVYEQAGDTGRQVKNFLHGTWLGHPLHASVTDVPVGSWTAALVMDALEDITGRDEFGTAADTAVAIGLAGAAVSAATGLTDWQATDGRARQIGIAHALLNTTGALLYTGSLIARRRDRRPLGRGLGMLGFVVAFAAAYLGGKLVYSEQVGVDHTADQKFPDDFRPVLADADLTEGQMRRVDVEGGRVLLARRDGHVYAIGEVCSHFGGPLSEGEFTGCTVQCPWHGSKFSLENGAVIDGPATHAQPALDVRIRDGQIEVRTRS